MSAIADAVRDYGPVIGLVGVAATLWINESRAERGRRRENHARAIEAVVAYHEMPYAIRRRRHEPDERSAERVRLSTLFGAVQAELASCEALMRADSDAHVRAGFAQLVVTLRTHAGTSAKEAWRLPPITDDGEMSLGDVHDSLEPVHVEQTRFEKTAARSTRTLKARITEGLRLSP
jgi:hypothetical protein